MTVWEILATVATAWLILIATSWVIFVMVTRKKAIEASIALKKRSIDKRVEAAALGAMAEGRGPIPGDSEEAAIEERAIKRMRGY